MALPIFQTKIQELSLMQTAWASLLNPFLKNPILQSLVLKNVALAPGVNTINHLLGRKLQGWKVVRQRASATLYDTQDSNPVPEKTLVLVASGAVNIDLEVF